MIEKGDRVRLVRTSDPYTRLRPGDLGTVTRVPGDTSVLVGIQVSWDSGSSLSMLPDEGDVIEKVSE